MTTHTDTEALIAEARRLIAHTRTYNFGMWSADKLAHKVAGELADALESTLADLRRALHDLEIVKEADWSRGIAAEARADELRIELRRERKERAEDRNEMVADAERLIDALEAEHRRAEEARWATGIVGDVSRDALGALQDAQAENAELRAAIEEALAFESVLPAIATEPRRILRAALDKEGNDDE